MLFIFALDLFFSEDLCCYSLPFKTMYELQNMVFSAYIFLLGIKLNFVHDSLVYLGSVKGTVSYECPFVYR